MDESREVLVWDRLVRIVHWLLAGSILVAWISAQVHGVPAVKSIHEWAGYVALGLIALRIAWGFIGSGYARFSQFLCSLATAGKYAFLVFRHQEPRYLGHNPLGAWMIVALLVTAFLASGSGWLYTTDRFWGVEWLEEIHELLADGLVGLVALHVAGGVFTSIRHRENLIKSMITGRKPRPRESDIT